MPIYAGLPAHEIPPLLTDSGVVAAFVSTAAQAAKVAAVRSNRPALRLVISFDPEPVPGADLTLHDLELEGGAE